MRTHADALIEIEAALLDDPVLQHPGLGYLALEIQISRVDARPGDLTQHRAEAIQSQVTWGEQVLADGLQHRIHGHSTTIGRATPDEKRRRCCCTGMRWRMAACSAPSREASKAASP